MWKRAIGKLENQLLLYNAPIDLKLYETDVVVVLAVRKNRTYHNSGI